MGMVFGYPTEWELFFESHPEFFRRVETLNGLLQRVFLRSGETGSIADRVIFFLGNLCAEDFQEILLLCGNGYGIGALKILRGMYEKCVTAGYLSSREEGEIEQEAERFLDWHHIDEWKLYRRVQETHKDPQFLTPDRVAHMKAEYERVKTTLPAPCKKCGKAQISWSKLDIFFMAQKAGDGLDQLYWSCYLVPTSQAHATSSAVYFRLEVTAEGGLSFRGGPQRRDANWALVCAHNLILRVVDLQIRHFKLGELTDDKERIFSDFQAIWGKKPGEMDPERVSTS